MVPRAISRARITQFYCSALLRAALPASRCGMGTSWRGVPEDKTHGELWGLAGCGAGKGSTLLLSPPRDVLGTAGGCCCLRRSCCWRFLAPPASLPPNLFFYWCWAALCFLKPKCHATLESSVSQKPGRLNIVNLHSNLRQPSQ